MPKEKRQQGLHSTKPKSTPNENESLACEKNGHERKGYKPYPDSMVMSDTKQIHKTSYREKKKGPQQKKISVVIEIAGRQLKCVSDDCALPVRHELLPSFPIVYCLGPYHGWLQTTKAPT
jgi:hypothetical protein